MASVTMNPVMSMPIITQKAKRKKKKKPAGCLISCHTAVIMEQ